MFLKYFPKHLIVTPDEHSKKGWDVLSRKAPIPQKVGHAVYFTPNGFDTLSREEGDVTQFNSIYIDLDCPKGATEDEARLFVKKKVGEVFTTIEPSFIVRTKNGVHCHFLLKESLEVTEDTKRNYIYVMDSMVKHFKADVGAKGINRVLRVPEFKHYKDIEDPYDVHLIHESPETRYTLDEIAEAIGVEYPEKIPTKDLVSVPTPTPTNLDTDEVFTRMMKKENIKKLYDGDISEHDDNHSSADLALCNHLAFWFGKDREVMRSIWLASPLGQRDKTQKRVDYQDRTLDTAITNCENVYTPKLPKKEVVGELDMDTLHYKENKDGVRTYSANLYNVMKVVEHYNVCKYDDFKCRYFVLEKGEWITRTDEVDMRLYERIANEYQFLASVSLAFIRSAVTKVSMDNRYDSAKEYCESLEWDGEARLDHWLHKVFGVEECQYHTDIGADWFKGMVLRMVVAGCKFDHALIIKGGQGIGKSTAFLELCSGFSDGINTTEFTDAKDKQLIEEIQGKVIAEFSEGAVFRKVDQETVKSIITRQYDRLRVPYEAHARDFPRRCVFAVTTNKDGFLKDDTGNRRWWVVDCGDFQHLEPSERPKADIKWLKENRDQLFAEAYHRVITLKESCHNVNEAELERRQTPFEDEHDDADLYTSAYHSLGEGTKLNGVTVRMIHKQAFPQDNNAHINKSTQMAIASVLKNPKGLNLKKVSRMHTTYWLPRDPFANFEVGITEEDAQKKIEEMISQENDY